MNVKFINNKFTLSFCLLLISVFFLTACDIVNKGQLPSKYVDDVVLTTKIKSNILTTKDIRSNDIHIESYNNTVQITGFVKDKKTYNKVYDIVRNTEGVKKVVNNLIIRK
ncbi:BON domain-containing protein [Rickettsiales endosymbiont of Trichoplax sp. H2]|uniref:BON domain-containing protein n=1 Tax=Rickettsiales endosymbiont of Trichoplax sp. H2 TaxID=2021221 RepID=UPI0012B3AAF6|nr:BON domain-containing protein [Rickettsiales endosymbiont of Trichoplax sp. H2]MSO13713.1 hypothetical protein [Rickettsiales endosymbiont of Trichoplax sp. H2]